MTSIKEHFADHGYYLAKGVYSPAEIAALERDFDRIVDQLSVSGERIDATWKGDATAQLARKDDVIIHTHNVQKYSRAWLDAFLNRRFLDAASEILGEDIVLHHSKLFQKPPENGSPFPMHQDWTYFPTEKDTMIAGIIHVSNATDEMGCLRVYDGSHRLGRVEGTNGRVASDLLADYPIERAQIIEAEPGDVVFFHYFTLHGSMPNRSSRTRKTVLVQLYAGDDKIESDNKHPNEGMVLRGWNHHSTRDNSGVYG